MAERVVVERIIRDLHAARIAGDLNAICAHFAERGRFRIAGASADKPIAISTHTLEEFRPWLAMMIKVFRLSGYTRDMLLVEGSHAAVQWRVQIYSKITGVTVTTDLVDLVEVENGRIVSYTEFFVPA